MKKIVILNGSTRIEGRTASLTASFAKGAKEKGHQVTEIRTSDLNFSGQLWSNDQYWKDNPYKHDKILALDNDLAFLSRAVDDADVLVFATPIYWWDISGSLKLAVDYLQPLLQAIGFKNFEKESVLLGVAGGSDFDLLESWYGNFEHYLNWKDLGRVLGQNKEAEAYQLGLSVE
ncbi:flavodoxin family protein [Secundilactobacillus folii]|uniref:NADPH-dependent FMN reductase-like domain-containing protein n=1 Tax=Secundilactobacillus folii TaxID=2678357 RepID=A0A7X2XV80_9LACO|nr:flavodoxin family protein [Secundilactobacillus folii]MTV82249.1 hypothetical protein [Secundilactobacillus folii]